VLFDGAAFGLAISTDLFSLLISLLHNILKTSFNVCYLLRGRQLGWHDVARGFEVNLRVRVLETFVEKEERATNEIYLRPPYA
jgi:hypothetical protein